MRCGRCAATQVLLPAALQPRRADTTPGAIAGEWQGQIRLIANALGVEIQEVRGKYDRSTTDRTFDVAFGTVEAGTCAAVRMQAIGVVDGRESIVIEHVTRLAHDIAPDWPTGIGDLSYRVMVKGEPNINCTMAVTLDDPRPAGIAGMKAGAGAMVATAPARRPRAESRF